MDKVLELRGIHKLYGRTRVLSDIDLCLQGGQFYALMGRNGAGKTTLLRIIMRYELPTQGTGTLLGYRLDADDARINQGIGYVTESFDYQIRQRLKSFFHQLGSLYPHWSPDEFARRCNAYGLVLDSILGDLSRGQKMQAAFAFALSIQPQLLVLDEITAVLDARARLITMEELAAFRERGGTVLMATNLAAEVQSYADHLLFLADTRLELNVPLGEIAQKFVKLLCRERPPAGVFADPRCVRVSTNSDGSSSYLLERVRLAEHHLTPDQMDHRGISVEEVFAYLTQSRPQELTGSISV